MPTTTATPAPTTSARATGLQLACPHCNEANANIILHLADGAFSCEECSEEINRDDIEGYIAGMMRWRKVFAWAEQIPTDGK